MSDIHSPHYEYIGYTLSWLCFNIILVLISIPIIIKLIKNSVYPPFDEKKPPKCLFNAGLLFLNITILCLIILILLGLFQLFMEDNNNMYDNSILYKLLIYSFGIIYWLQKYTLLIVLFIRLKFVFNPTPLAITDYTLKLFITLFIITPILLISLSLFVIMYNDFIIEEHDNNTNYLYVFLGIFVVLYNIFLILCVLSLFIYKLIQVYRIEYDMSFIQVIAKITIIAAISIIVAFIGPFCIILRYTLLLHNEYMFIITDYIISIEIFINFLCVIISYKYFKKYYEIFCCCIISLCHSFWFNTLYDDKRKNTMYDIKTNQINPHRHHRHHHLNVITTKTRTTQTRTIRPSDNIIGLTPIDIELTTNSMLNNSKIASLSWTNMTPTIGENIEYTEETKISSAINTNLLSGINEYANTEPRITDSNFTPITEEANESEIKFNINRALLNVGDINNNDIENSNKISFHWIDDNDDNDQNNENKEDKPHYM